MRIILLTFLPILICISLSAQDATSTNSDQNPRKIRPFGTSLGGAYFLTAESGILFFSADYFVIPQLSFAANIGVTDFEELYYAVGIEGHLNSKTSQSRFTPFVGAFVGKEYYDYMVQFPLGLEYISRKGFNASLSINQLIYFNSYQSTFVDLKIGWRFKR